MLRIAGPTVATMSSYTAMTFTDKWLVSRMGPELVGAQGNGGLAAWVPTAFAYGVLQVVNTYVSQNLGAGKPERGPAYAWNAMYIAAAFSLLLIPYAFCLPAIFRIAEIDPNQAALAASYGRILIFGTFLNLATRAFSQFFFGMHKGSVVMVAGITANIINLFISAMLVFGPNAPADLGLLGRICASAASALSIKPMGIEGSAIGTVIATGVELAIPFAVFLSPKMNALYRTRSAWRFSWRHIRDIMRIGWPGGLMFANEMVCWGYFMVYLVSHFGPNHASAGWMAHQYMSISFMPAVGISVACTAIVGKHMGAKRPDLAQKGAWLGVRLACIYMGICAIIFVVFRSSLVRLFIEDGTDQATVNELVRLGSAMLIATAAFQLFDAVAMVLSGALRGAGDTIFPGVATVIAAWALIVGGGTLLVRMVPGLESLGAWIGAASYIAALCIILLYRFMSGKWKSIKVLREDPIAH